MKKQQPEWLFTIDPGKTFGWALFHMGVLVDCGHCSMSAWFNGKLSPSGVRAEMRLPPTPEQISGLVGVILVAEKPTYYQTRMKRAAAPNDLITLAITLGELIGVYRRKVDTVELVTAKDWKGSTDKDICHRRAQKVLKPEENFPQNHNARDAVVIGFWRVGRYGNEVRRMGG